MVKALRAGDYFVTSGEVLLRNWAVEGSGAKRDLRRRSGVDVPSGFRRAGLERWNESATGRSYA